ncbi:MAG: LacI family transcriptional regulator [Lachnospiraceae bacterium]|nr:LacI family transcriptional regulator [Lachnospiraceae bacterium]
MIGIKDVAKRAGVAVSTVSKVVNDYPNVSEATKKKVNKAIRELGFVPNAVAQALSSKQPGRIALIMNDTTQSAVDEIDMQYLAGALVKARELNLDVVTLFVSMIRNKSIDEIITYLRSQNVRGFVVFGLSKDEDTMLELLKTTTFKKVVVDAPLVNDSTSTVWVDQCAAQYDVVAKMLETVQAHRILYLAGKENSFVMDGRLAGMNRIAEERGCEILVRRADFSEKKAREVIFNEKESYDMVVSASDLMAIGAMRALTEMDVFKHVCGFDGISLMGYAGKQMTTVRQDFKKIAETAVGELAALLEGNNKGREIVLPHEIVRMEYLDVIS